MIFNLKFTIQFQQKLCHSARYHRKIWLKCLTKVNNKRERYFYYIKIISKEISHSKPKCLFLPILTAASIGWQLQNGEWETFHFINKRFIYILLCDFVIMPWLCDCIIFFPATAGRNRKRSGAEKKIAFINENKW